ncbi:MAG: glycosyltransferase family 2 protein [Nanoarchaeota archaeon]|nr:glycosyltransferase family 2 protein [Nanoarchaeota archaeon]MBU1004647.1 glycosyltransferase family 2 protein [Nanoarchaeota archaeon]MBU1946201.1 glycosyltransferase family 2 protein [Nanoarchaeota archaeon]
MPAETFIRVMIWFAYLISLYFVVFWLLVLFEGKKQEPKKKLKTLPIVTIAIPSYNEEKRIKATLTDILKLDYPINKLEFIVVNDGSKDKTKEITEKIIKENKKFNITLINQKNKGKGAALNAALKRAKGEFFVCLDADSFVEKTALKTILPYFTEDNIACVLPVMKVRKPKNLLQRMQWFEYIINMFYKELMSRLNCIHVAPGPFSVYKTDIIKNVGSFDENFNLTEDLEMALRLQSKHYRIIQLLEGQVTTIAPQSLRSLYRQRNRWYKGSIHNAFKYRKMIFNKNYGDFGMIQMPLILVGGILSIIIIGAMAYYNFWLPMRSINQLKYVNFDLVTLIRNFNIDFHLLDINFASILTAIIMLVLSIYIFVRSHKHTKENVNKYSKLSILIYLIGYFMLLGIIWVGILFEMAIGKKQRW